MLAFRTHFSLSTQNLLITSFLFSPVFFWAFPPTAKCHFLFNLGWNGHLPTEWVHGWKNEMGCWGGNKDSLLWDGFLKNLLTLHITEEQEGMAEELSDLAVLYAGALDTVTVSAKDGMGSPTFYNHCPCRSSPFDVSNDTLPNLFMNMFPPNGERKNAK